MDKRIQKIVERWYLNEPAFFQIFCTHNLEENGKMSCPFRCGKGKIEYNPQLIGNLEYGKLESYLKAEVIRILLKHPYERKPDGCRRKSIAIGSNLVLADNYDFSNIGMEKPADYGLKGSESYEWYSYRIEHVEKGKDSNESTKENSNTATIPLPKTAANKQGNGTNGQKGSTSLQIQMPDGTMINIPPANGGKTDSGDSNKDDGDEDGQNDNGVPTDKKSDSATKNTSNKSLDDLSSLWQEDSIMACSIDIAIDEIEASHGWGSLEGNLSEKILANTKAKIDYRKVLSGFRASVLSSKRHLTRMRPNRRTGFDNMGSIRRFDTNLLVAVDVSGSISTQTLRHFYSIINRAFKYGIEHIDAVQFDVTLKKVESFDKAQKEILALGRGGTNFQQIIDYVAAHPKYDGLIIFTDGEAPIPKVPKRMRCKIVWVCNSKENYNENHQWMKKIGRCCVMEI